MSDNQLIIAIDREFGSGGLEIAKKLSTIYDIPLYDSNMLHDIALERNASAKKLKQYDEVSKNPFLSRTVRGFSNSPEDAIAQLQFAYLKERANKGESFIALGRCCETILRDYPGCISIFILADEPTKIENVMAREGISKFEAPKYIRSRNKKRKQYHNYYSDTKWGDSRNYDFSINTSRLGFDGTITLIQDYISLKSKR